MGDFICLAGEREKQCPSARLPLNAGELTALSTHIVHSQFYFIYLFCFTIAERREKDDVAEVPLEENPNIALARAAAEGQIEARNIEDAIAVLE